MGSMGLMRYVYFILFFPEITLERQFAIFHLHLFPASGGGGFAPQTPLPRGNRPLEPLLWAYNLKKAGYAPVYTM